MINYSFDYKSVKYNCAKCKGLCCNINGQLHFTKEQINKINIGDLLIDYLSREGERGYYKCKIPKRCWFLGQNGCTLEADAKPLECRMYPLVVWRLSERNIVCEINPCPDFAESSGQSLYNDGLNKLIQDYEENIGVSIHPYMKKIKYGKSIDEDQVLAKRKLYNEKLYKECEENLNGVIKELTKLFSQIIVHPIGFYLDDTEVEMLKSVYIDLCRKHIEKYKTTNFQNLYIITRNEALKRALLLFYYPENKSLEDTLGEEDIKILDMIKQEKSSFLKTGKINMFFRFYKDNSTQWVKKGV